jgi:inner membrane protein
LNKQLLKAIHKLDSVTHIVLGACIGEAIAGKQVGKRALFLGAFAQSFPDIDFVGAFFLAPADNILVHRGLTHSIIFAIVATWGLAHFTKWYFRKRKIASRVWILLFSVNIFSHIFIDSFNAYGTGWFEPFSHQRISFNTIFVADPLFSLWPFIACIVLTYLRLNNKNRKIWWQSALALSCLYLIYTNINKLIIDKDVKATLGHKQLSDVEYFTTPSPFNSLLWFVTIKAGKGFYTGYKSVFDKDPKIDLNYFPRNDSLLRRVKDQEEVKDLLRFSEGYYTVEKWHDTTVFNVLRFGQIVGWYDPREKFVFHYFLDKPGANELVTQRGRFENWNDTTIHSLIEKIKGK